MRALLEAPFGHVQVTVGSGKVTDVRLSAQPAKRQVPERFPAYVLEAMDAYLEGRAPRPIAPFSAPGTEFQQAVWSSLADIPPGQTRTYGQLAAAIGKPGAAQAVGQALRRNPLPLVQPCHRVVAADGLGGFGGCAEASGDEQLEVKRWLLEHERLELALDDDPLATPGTVGTPTTTSQRGSTGADRSVAGRSRTQR